MARSQVKLTYSAAGTSPFDLDISVSRSRFYRARFAPGETKVVSGLTLDELDASPIMQSLVSAGTFVLSVDEGDADTGLKVGISDVSASSEHVSVLGVRGAVPFVIRVPFTAGTQGSADDVAVLAPANVLPFAVRLLDVEVLTSTAIATSTATLRTATGGTGTALSSALTTAATGRARTTLLTNELVAASTPMYLRRSDRGAAGEVVITLIRE